MFKMSVGEITIQTTVDGETSTVTLPGKTVEFRPRRRGKITEAMQRLIDLMKQGLLLKHYQSSLKAWHGDDYLYESFSLIDDWHKQTAVNLNTARALLRRELVEVVPNMGYKDDQKSVTVYQLKS